MSPALRLAPRHPARASVIVDMGHRARRFDCPWTMSEVERAYNAPVPHKIVAAMYVAAWARAEHCPLNVTAGRLEPHGWNEPSDDLWCETARSMWMLVGALGFAIPILRDREQRAFGVGWRYHYDGGN